MLGGDDEVGGLRRGSSGRRVSFTESQETDGQHHVRRRVSVSEFNADDEATKKFTAHQLRHEDRHKNDRRKIQKHKQEVEQARNYANKVRSLRKRRAHNRNILTRIGSEVTRRRGSIDRGFEVEMQPASTGRRPSFMDSRRPSFSNSLNRRVSFSSDRRPSLGLGKTGIETGINLRNSRNAGKFASVGQADKLSQSEMKELQYHIDTLDEYKKHERDEMRKGTHFSPEEMEYRKNLATVGTVVRHKPTVHDELPDLKLSARWKQFMKHLQKSPKLGTFVKVVMIVIHLMVVMTMVLPYELPVFSVDCLRNGHKSGLQYDFYPMGVTVNMVGTRSFFKYETAVVRQHMPTVHAEANLFQSLYDLLSSSLTFLWFKILFLGYQYSIDHGQGIKMRALTVLGFFTGLACLETMSGAAIMMDSDSFDVTKSGPELCAAADMDARLDFGIGLMSLWASFGLICVLLAFQVLVCTHPKFTRDRAEYQMMKNVAKFKRLSSKHLA